MHMLLLTKLLLLTMLALRPQQSLAVEPLLLLLLLSLVQWQLQLQLLLPPLLCDSWRLQYSWC